MFNVWIKFIDGSEITGFNLPSMEKALAFVKIYSGFVRQFTITEDTKEI